MTMACRSPATRLKRAEAHRRRAAMPRRTPPEIVALIDKLLLGGLDGKTPMAPLVVRDYLIKHRAVVVSPARIYQEQEFLARTQNMDKVRTVREGQAPAGRPKGSKDVNPRKPYRTPKEHKDSRREAVLRLHADGLTPTEIAEKLGMTPEGVRFHIRKVKKPEDPK